MTKDIQQELENVILELIGEVSSIRAGKTIRPRDYSDPVVEAINSLVREVVGAEVPVADTEDLEEKVYIVPAQNQLRSQILNKWAGEKQ